MIKQDEPHYRHELKYIISRAELELLKVRLKGLIPQDPHVLQSGAYAIRSLYFDDNRNTAFFENEEGTDPREKFRIRIYNHASDIIKLECKRKERGKTLKTSCTLTREQACCLMDGRCPDDISRMQPLLQKLTAQMKMRQLKPVIIVEYERIPYICKLGNVRITFDTNISSSSFVSGFLDRDIPRRPVLPAGMHLLEVKYDDYLPDYIYNACQLDNLQRTAFSKYYICRKYSLR